MTGVEVGIRLMIKKKYLIATLLLQLSLSFIGCSDNNAKDTANAPMYSSMEKIVQSLNIPVEITMASYTSIPIGYVDHQFFAVLEMNDKTKEKLFSFIATQNKEEQLSDHRVRVFVPKWFDINLLPEGTEKRPPSKLNDFDVYSVPNGAYVETEIFDAPRTTVIQLSNPNAVLLVYSTQ
tara:strand:+ start:189 stop:725 length:537 start_codon:yes stop_codon:yes gene_type:complete